MPGCLAGRLLLAPWSTPTLGLFPTPLTHLPTLNSPLLPSSPVRSVDQVLRLLAATHALPVELSIALELHARSEPADCWYSALLQRLRQEQRAAAELVNGAVPMTPFKHLHHAAAVKQRVA